MIRVIEAFSGIGSQAKALKRAGISHEIVHTIEWDINAIIAYDLIHNGIQPIDKYRKMSDESVDCIIDKYNLSMDGKSPMTERQRKLLPRELKDRLAAAIVRTSNLGSIAKLAGKDLEDDIDLLTYSFPCQDLSIAGVWHGLNTGISKNIENRSGMLWQVERILKENHDKGRKLPKFLLMENVTNILSQRHIGDFNLWKKTLDELGYVSKVYKLNAMNFGVPQRRERVFMLSALSGDNPKTRQFIEDYFNENDLEKPMLSQMILKETRSVSDFLRLDMTQEKYRREADESQPNDTPSRTQIWEDNLKIIDENYSVTKESIPTITTKQDRNPNSGVIFYNSGIEGKAKYRYLTPRECFLLMGFDERDYDMLVNNNFNPNRRGNFFTSSKLIKMAGNSIVVDVLVEIFKQVDDLRSKIEELDQQENEKTKVG